MDDDERNAAVDRIVTTADELLGGGMKLRETELCAALVTALLLHREWVQAPLPTTT